MLNVFRVSYPEPFVEIEEEEPPSRPFAECIELAETVAVGLLKETPVMYTVQITETSLSALKKARAGQLLTPQELVSIGDVIARAVVSKM